MITITDKEFENDFEKYNKIASREEIIILKQGKPAYFLKPVSSNSYENAMSLVGILPKDATIGTDPDERG